MVIINKILSSKKIEKSTILMVLLCSLSATVYIARNSIDYRYELLWILPAAYFFSTAIFYIFFQKTNYQYGIVFVASIFIIFFRYVVTSFSIVFFSNYDGLGYGPNPQFYSMNTAIILMVIELILTYITITIAAVYFKKNKKSITNFNGSNILKNKTIVVSFVLLFLLIVLAASPNSLVPNLSYFAEDLSISSPETGNISGILFLFIPVLRLCLLFLVLSLVKSSYDKSGKFFYIIIGWIAVFYYLSLVISSSRWVVVFSAVMCMGLMKYLFPKTPKIYFFILFSLLVITFFAISINKYSWSVRNSSNLYLDIIQVLSLQFQEYFSGPRVVAQSLEMAEVYNGNMTVVTLLNDFLGSIPFVSNFIDQTNRTNVFFNSYLNVNNNSHIIPMLGNGYAYLPFFPSFLMVGFQWLMVYFDSQYQNKSNWEMKYLFGYMGLYFSMSMGFNVQIIFGNFLSFFLIPWMLFKINEKVVLRPKRNKIIVIGGK